LCRVGTEDWFEKQRGCIKKPIDGSNEHEDPGKKAQSIDAVAG
jgi:hypothetical protein